MFRSKLTKACQKEDTGKGGRPPIDVIVEFKASTIKRIYNLSYEQTEYQINDRLSFMRILGISLSDRVLDANTIWDFENTLAQAGLMEELFCMFDAMLEEWEKPENAHKLAQKDTDARWTKKNNEVHFGYKDHVKCDADSKPITNYGVTDAALHDSQRCTELLEEQTKRCMLTVLIQVPK